MKRLFLLLPLALFACGGNERAPEAVSERVARDFIRRYPCADSIHWAGQSNHFSWQAGYIMLAMEKMWLWTGDEAYGDYVRKYVDDQVGADGSVPDFRPDALDNFLPGSAVLFVHDLTGEERYRIAAEHIRRGFDDYPRTSNGLFWHSTGWAEHQSWIVGVFMGQAFLARYGAEAAKSDTAESERAFAEVAHQMLTGAEMMIRPDGHILHAWDESRRARWADPETGLAPAVWSEGMGWYAVMIADVFDYLPADHPSRPALLDILRRMCAGLRTSQDARTGLWCQVVDRPDAPGNWNETSGSGQFLYLIQKAINDGHIPADEYAAVARRAYEGLLTRTRVNGEGFIDLIDCSSIGPQESYEAYIAMPRETSPFAAFGSWLLGVGLYEFTVGTTTAAVVGDMKNRATFVGATR